MAEELWPLHFLGLHRSQPKLSRFSYRCGLHDLAHRNLVDHRRHGLCVCASGRSNGGNGAKQFWVGGEHRRHRREPQRVLPGSRVSSTALVFLVDESLHWEVQLGF